MTEQNISNLPITPLLLKNLHSLGYKKMTEVQEISLPKILEKKDLIVKAKTGSGKTLCFTLGVLNNLDSNKYRIQALILCPTRELAFQVSDVIKKVVRYMHNIKVLNLTGGVPYKPQVHSLSHQAHIVVGTPGRVLKHLQENNFSTDDINSFVLDEADRMLDMGFIVDIESILSYLKPQRQNLFFSATLNENCIELSKKIMENSEIVETTSLHTATSIEQMFYEVQLSNKKYFLGKCFEKGLQSCILFCNTKIECDQLADYLEETYDMEPLVLHSDYEQKYRDETLVLFENKSYPLLIATDIAARGLDINSVDLVINYEMPLDFENYVHRIGRTARSGKSGKSISFIEDREYLEDLNQFLNEKFELSDLSQLEQREFHLPSHDYSTLYISGGKKDKLRAGDILGTLIQAVGLEKEEIGKISIFPKCAYVAIKNKNYEKAYKKLNSIKIKNKFFRVYKR